jgi:hypothetical protein
VTNNGAALTGAAVTFDSLPSGITLANGNGLTSCTAPASPYMSIPGTLGTNQNVVLTLQFTDPSQAAITYVTRVLGGSGAK